MNNSRKSTVTRANIPGWLSNPDGMAPCLCGRPLRPGEIPLVATGELGLKRWFHHFCWNMMIDHDDDDDFDYDDEE